jgi:Uma2 family endonuclease
MIEDSVMAVQPKRVTVSEFEEFIGRPKNEDRRFELLDGRILENALTEELGVFTVNIGTEFKLYSREYGGRVAVEVRYNNPDDPYNDRIPDVSYTSAARMLPLVKAGAVPQMPDVAVEVKSPDDTYTKMRRKAAFYIENGARMVWLVFPEKRQVEVYYENGDLEILDENGVLDGGDVMPGFTMTVRAVYEE